MRQLYYQPGEWKTRPSRQKAGNLDVIRLVGLNDVRVIAYNIAPQDARLVAAAPSMLRELRHLVAMMEGTNPGFDLVGRALMGCHDALVEVLDAAAPLDPEEIEAQPKVLHCPANPKMGKADAPFCCQCPVQCEKSVCKAPTSAEVA